jgi:hypothetical protein
MFTLLRDLVGEGACGNGACGNNAVLLAEHWHLDRKIREIWAANGIEAEKAARIVEIAKAVIKRMYGEEIKNEKLTMKNDGGLPGHSPADPKTDKFNFSLLPFNVSFDSPYALMLALYDSEDFRRLIGVNVFDGVVWFNKERFEETLEYAALFAAPQAGPEKAQTWAAAIKHAEEASSYRLDVLLAALGKRG